MKAVASFSILGDFVQRVGGGRVAVTTLVGADSDAHAFQPKPDDVKAMAAADVVFINGFAFEGWFDRLVDVSGYAGKVSVASDGVKAREMTEDHHAHESGDEDHGAVDPHAWQDAQNVLIYVRNIAAALCEADAPGCDSYQVNAAAYSAELQALDADIKASFEKVPDARRVVITSHDAFGYFAAAYGVKFLAPEGVSTESEASAKDVARLITQIREYKASALFVENISDPRLIEQIARETGLKLGGSLYSDALSAADGPAATYIKMMRHNADAISAAMAGS